MDLIIAMMSALALFAIGGGTGWVINNRIRQIRETKTRNKVQSIVEEAHAEAESLKKTATLIAKDEWRKEREPLEREIDQRKRTLQNIEGGLLEKERQLDHKVDILEDKELSLNRVEKELSRREEKLSSIEKNIQTLIKEQEHRLEELAGLSRAEARTKLIEQQEDNARQFAARKVREIKDEAIAMANREAKEIISRSIQQYGGELALESTVSVVNLPSEEMKGRIIGRDGRNIRAFDMITGVEIVVDDTPGSVLLSSFDPMRREVAKTTLEKLILDGRIHPGRIEETYEKARMDVEELIRESGSKAAFDLGIHDMPEPLLELLGKLRFQSSYGQNLLAHCQEVGMLAGLIAERLEIDVTLARRAGLLHDIGKALSHEVGTDSAQASGALARKCGESVAVIEVIETHNLELLVRSVIAITVKTADEISNSRPGAHKEKVEEYVTRMQNIEEIAGSYPGVRSAFAVQNGKEVRVMIDSDTVNDTNANQLADEITESLEEDLDQPGQIKVCVIRELRAVHYAR